MLINLKYMLDKKENRSYVFNSLLELGYRFEESDPNYFIDNYREDIILVLSIINYFKDNGCSLEEIFDLDNTSSSDTVTIDFAYDFYNTLSEIYDTIIK